MEMKRDHDGTCSEVVVLSPEVVEFIESGVSIIVGVAGADGKARTGRAIAARLTEKGALRLIYPEEGNAALTEAASRGGLIAVAFSAPLSHRTIQLKGAPCRPDKLGQADHDAVSRQADAFAAILSAIGYPSSFAEAYCDYRTSPLQVLVFPPLAAFEQTPGPGAGRPL